MSTKRGRPPLDPTDPSTKVCVVLPSKRYDLLYALAAAERVTVPDLIRRSIADALRNPKSPTRSPRR